MNDASSWELAYTFNIAFYCYAPSSMSTLLPCIYMTVFALMHNVCYAVVSCIFGLFFTNYVFWLIYGTESLIICL